MLLHIIGEQYAPLCCGTFYVKKLLFLTIIELISDKRRSQQKRDGESAACVDSRSNDVNDDDDDDDINFVVCVVSKRR